MKKIYTNKNFTANVRFITVIVKNVYHQDAK